MGNTAKKVLRVRKYHKWGYELRDEIWNHGDLHPTTMERQAYNLQGQWIGKSKWAYQLFHKKGIYPELSDSKHCVCSIGFSQKLRKWFGWSHRAICGFGIGDRVFEEEFGNDHTPFIQHGSKTIKDLGQARIAATRFAASVS